MHIWTALRPMAVVVGATIAALILNRAAEAAVGRLAARRPDSPLWLLLRRCRMPFVLAVGSALALAAEPGAGLGGVVRGPVRHSLLLLSIAATCWLLSRIVALLVDMSLTSYATPDRRRDPARIRRVRTQADLVRRIAGAGMCMVAVAATSRATRSRTGPGTIPP